MLEHGCRVEETRRGQVQVVPSWTLLGPVARPVPPATSVVAVSDKGDQQGEAFSGLITHLF